VPLPLPLPPPSSLSLTRTHPPITPPPLYDYYLLVPRPPALQREREEERTVYAKDRILAKTVTHNFFSDEGLRCFDAYEAFDTNAALLNPLADEDFHQLPVLGTLTLLAATVAMATTLERNVQDINLYLRICETGEETMAKVSFTGSTCSTVVPLARGDTR
jgi:hypothetical protein